MYNLLLTTHEKRGRLDAVAQDQGRGTTKDHSLVVWLQTSQGTRPTRGEQAQAKYSKV